MPTCMQIVDATVRPFGTGMSGMSPEGPGDRGMLRNGAIEKGILRTENSNRLEANSVAMTEKRERSNEHSWN